MCTLTQPIVRSPLVESLPQYEPGPLQSPQGCSRCPRVCTARASDCQMLLDISDQSPDPLALKGARALVRNIPTGPLDWLFIMHLQGVGSHTYSAAGGLKLRECNTKLPVLTTKDAITATVPSSDRSPELGLGEMPALTCLADVEALRWRGRPRQAGDVLRRQPDPEKTDPGLVFAV